MGERERASERKQRHKSTTKYLGWNEKISLWNETASLSLSSQSLIDVLFRLMNYARKVTICRYLGIGSTRKLFTGKKKTIFKLPIAIYSPLHSHNLALTHSPPHPLYNIRKKQKKEKNSIEIRNVPLHSTKTTTELESKEENSVSFFDEPNIIHILNPAPVLYLCFIAVLLSSCSFVVDYGIINLTVSFRCVWFFLRYMYTMLIIIVIFFTLRSVCVCDFYCFKKWQEQCL